MPGCAAIGCNNRSEKGYTMKCFPRDPNLRKVWKERVGRADWEPSNNSFLCHMHFEPEQWVVTHSGRVKLRKDAMPSIFTVTSTRKSPKKRRQWDGYKRLNDTHDDYMVEYLENDIEYPSLMAFQEENAEKSDSLDDNESVVALDFEKLKTYPKKKKLSEKRHMRATYQIVGGKELRDLEKENVIIVSDENNQELGKLVHDNKFIIVADENDKEIGQIIANHDILEQQSSSAPIKIEMKPLIGEQSTVDHSYDEIEEKLKQICDGETSTRDTSINSSNPELKFSICKEKSRYSTVSKTIKDDTKRNFKDKSIFINNADSKSTIKKALDRAYLDKEISGNVQIIFGPESGDECVKSTDSNLSYSCQNSSTVSKVINDGTHQVTLDDKNVHIKKEKTIFSEDIEENFSKDEVYVIPNMRAAMKRKRRTREEIMKSIERTIGRMTEKDQDNLRGTNQLFDANGNNRQKDISLMEEKLQNFSNDILELDESDVTAKKSKFTIKVIGVSEDVTDIMKGLSVTTSLKHNPGADLEIPCQDNKGNAFITSVVAVRDRLAKISKENEEKDDSNDYDNSKAEDEYIIPEKVIPRSNDNRKASVQQKHSALGMEQRFKSDREYVHSEELNINSAVLLKKRGSRRKGENSNRQMKVEDQNEIASKENEAFDKPCPANNSVYLWEESQRKINLQKEVINKLTNQLIMYKDLESKMINMKLELKVKNKEIESLTRKLNKKLTNEQDQFANKKELVSKQRLIQDLSNRVNQLDKINKKLMKTVTLDSQEKRKLESQIKQRDNRMKELNWKLGKASKFLERAERNTITYKRKMLNMQTLMRRKKLTDEKQDEFKEMMIDGANHDFSEATLATAMDIKSTCGKKCYEMLLNYNFPLPSLRTLQRRFLKDNTTKDNWNNEEITLDTLRKDIKIEKPEVTAEVKATQINDAKVITSKTNANETEINEQIGDTQTITGTVQDIFDENNDGDLNSCELSEHFILQLRTIN